MPAGIIFVNDIVAFFNQLQNLRFCVLYPHILLPDHNKSYIKEFVKMFRCTEKITVIIASALGLCLDLETCTGAELTQIGKYFRVVMDHLP